MEGTSTPGLPLHTAGHAPTPFRPWWQPFAPVMAGFVLALVNLAPILSYVALLYAGTPPDVQAHGLFVLLMSSIIMGVAGALLSSLPVTCVVPDGSIVAALSAIAAMLVTSLPGAASGVLSNTLSVALAATAMLTGLALLGIGWTRAGSVVRFVPLQVMAGVMTASGWTLLAGGIVVTTGHPLSMELVYLPDARAHLLPAMGWAVVMLVVTRKVQSPLVLPAMILAGIGLHHAVFAGLHLGIGQQQAEGWLMTVPERLVPVMAWSPSHLASVQWSALLPLAPAIGAAVVIACVTVLVSANGLELLLHRDVDLDRDLRANGAASLMAGLAGGVPGAISAGRSALLYRLGGRGRTTPALVAVLSGVVPMAAPGLLGLVPRPVLGALLILLGFNLINTWLVQTRLRLARAEWLTVLAVLLVTIWFGLPAAVLTGLALGCATFAVIYSQGSPIRARYRGDVARSNVDRADADQAVLRAESDAVLVLYLQGFLFFGTVSRLLQEVKDEVARPASRLRHLILDCSNIDGLDGSARATLERLQQVAATRGISLTYAALPPAAALRLGVVPGAAAGMLPTQPVFAPSLDLALERAEVAILGRHAIPAGSVGIAGLIDTITDPADVAALRSALVSSIVPAGATLMSQGEASQDMLFLARGQADVLVVFDGGPEARVRGFGPGTMMGEIGFLLDTPRTATVRATTECEVLTLTREALQSLEATRSNVAIAFQRAVMARLSQRLLDKDQLIAALVRGTRRVSQPPGN